MSDYCRHPDGCDVLHRLNDSFHSSTSRTNLFTYAELVPLLPIPQVWRDTCRVCIAGTPNHFYEKEEQHDIGHVSQFEE